MTDDVSASLVRFALDGPEPLPDVLRSAVSGLPDAAPATGRDGHLAALRSAYPPGDLRADALNTAAGLARSGTHPLFAATAAVAGTRNPERAPEATVLACEVACRIAASLGVRPEALAVVGAALAGSREPDGGLRALGLAAAQATTVTGNAGEQEDTETTGSPRPETTAETTDSPRPETTAETTDSPRPETTAEVTALRAALAAADGMEAALLGERGFTAPAQPLEGRRGLLALLAPRAEARELLRDLGTRWSAEHVAGEASGAAGGARR